jgi:hypothetical protein
LIFLEGYHKGGNEFLIYVVQITRDETRISCVMVETKEQSKQWMHTNSPNTSENSNKLLYLRRLMATIIRDRKGVLMVEFMQQGISVTSEVYCETKNLHGAIQNKRQNADIHCSASP